MAAKNHKERAAVAAMDCAAFMRYAREYRRRAESQGAILAAENMRLVAHFAHMARVAHWRQMYWRVAYSQRHRLAALLQRNSRV